MTLTKTEPLPVNSTLLASVAYDPTESTLRVEFRNGAIYHYIAVPSDVHRGLLAAESKGSFFNHLIRNRFPYALIRRPR